jgi:hypothetical protein
MPSNSDAVRRSIGATVSDIQAAEAAFAARGVDVSDYEDRAEAMDILNRIERRMMANMATGRHSEAAE